MQFRLVYQGRLPAQSQSNHRIKEKHEIRKVLHKQLRELWDKHPFLSEKKGTLVSGMRTPDIRPSILGETLIDYIGRNPPPRLSVVELMADDYAKCGYRFVPLVSSRDGVACALDILFLRRDDPGNLIRSGGDIDNRIKVLFDALRIPENQELVGQNPTEDENPFFCLLEDDRLVTEVNVTTDRLLLPAEEGEHLNDVHLVMHVRTLEAISKPGVMR